MPVLRILLSILLVPLLILRCPAQALPEPEPVPDGGLLDEAGIFPVVDADGLRVAITDFHSRTGLYVTLVTRRYAGDRTPETDSADSHRLWIEPYGSGVAVAYDTVTGNVGFSASRSGNFPPPDTLQEILSAAGKAAAAEEAGEPQVRLTAFVRTILDRLTEWHATAVIPGAGSDDAAATASPSFKQLLRIGLIVFCAVSAVFYIRERIGRWRSARDPSPPPASPVPQPDSIDTAFRFPEVSVARRLGAPRGGGIVAVVPAPDPPSSGVRTEAPAPETTQAGTKA